MRTLTDTEQSIVVGGEDFETPEGIRDFARNFCADHPDGKLEITIKQPEGKGSLGIFSGGGGGGSITIKIDCGPGGKDNGNDDGDDSEETEDSADSEE